MIRAWRTHLECSLVLPWEVGLAVVLLGLLLGVPVSATGQSFAGTVHRVLDGDTVHLLRDTGQIVRVELYGVDAPERVQPYGAKARQAVRRAVAEGRDEDGRPHYELRVGDRVLNEQLVREGLAWWDRRQAPHADHLQHLERQARADERGLWAQTNPVPPWEWRAKRRDP
ncbi:MAG: chromosome partitioning protein ParB [Bacteroidetes bacterium QS_1_63_11]|nr:MAG: chromosome partitioning protein ParB [Bacteroidetes bacterium QS_1_63_11]